MIKLAYERIWKETANQRFATFGKFEAIKVNVLLAVCNNFVYGLQVIYDNYKDYLPSHY